MERMRLCYRLNRHQADIPAGRTNDGPHRLRSRKSLPGREKELDAIQGFDRVMQLPWRVRAQVLANDKNVTAVAFLQHRDRPRVDGQSRLKLL